MDNLFTSVFKFKLIYIFEIRSERHRGLLKIGDATIETDEPIDNLPPNCKLLNKAANKRIKEYTNTAGIDYNLLHTELAVRLVKNKEGNLEMKAFRDHHVHKVLENSGIPKVRFENSTSQEWFEINIETALSAVEAVKKGLYNLSGEINKSTYTPIIFRPEQLEAINRTLKQFKKGNRMLWNAKMRFGKTLSALEVVRKLEFKKTIIITHRPVVDSGWYEDFNKIFYSYKNYIYGSKNTGYTIEDLLKQDKNFVYFTSIQDLRGSDMVGGKFDKNDSVFDTIWDFVIVDEAHEGTTTALGNEVIKKVVKEDLNKTKFLALSGTPFNILGEYDDNIYTWDYIMEQSSKYEWDKKNLGDSNPYAELPKLKIYTYDLGKLIDNKEYRELEDKAFNFREFFRVWTGDIKLDHRPMPEGTKVGEFVHRNDVWSFLNLITKKDKYSQYPYATEEYRDLFRHSLWMVPGVKEARALSDLMRQHHIFGSGAFNIVNVAGDGDEEEKSDDALEKVQTAIKNAGSEGYTITLSCGKLTTGVTVPEWTAVFYLTGSFSTSASNYLQTIFRVQSPCNKNGKIKTAAYVFDFAPDRTLKMITESVAISAKAGKTDTEDRLILGEFLNYCPVISVEGTNMKEYDTSKLLQQLKRAYAERAVKNGFDDNNLYNDELLKLDNIDLENFKKLKGIIGKSKSSHNANEININNLGFTDEEYEELEKIKNKPKKKRTKEEEKLLEEIKEKRKQANNARSILRGISIRMPLLIYGADIDDAEDITMEKLVEIVDDSSWKEFMPEGVTKDIFRKFIKYYDPEIFIVAGRKIRDIAKGADKLPPKERVIQIADLFSNFKNPDKETVLTPWRIVNMHMGDCLGGYNFYDEGYRVTLDNPRYINNNEITQNTLSNLNAKILEINSKTGLYPLYLTYSIFRKRCEKYSDLELTLDVKNKLWEKTVEENIFIICKTPMAKSITKRTLLGFKDISPNAVYFEDLNNMMKNKSKQLVDRITRVNYWKKEGMGKLKFDAIVGNPPYQEMDGGAQASASPIYQHFVKTAKDIKPEYISFIMPTRWYVGGKGLDDFRKDMLNDIHLKVLYDCLTPEDIFPNTNIRGGVCYYLWDSNYDNKRDLTRVVTLENNQITSDILRPFKIEGIDIFIRDGKAVSIINKIFGKKNQSSLESFVSVLRPFGLRGYFIKSSDFHIEKLGVKNPIICYGRGQTIGYVDRKIIKTRTNWIDKWKVFTPRANNIGTELSDDNFNTFIGKPGTICTESYIVIGADLELEKYSAENLSKYLRSKFARYMHSLAKASQDATAKTYRFVPIQDFTDRSDIDWNKSIEEIDKQLYKKYNLSDEEINYIEHKIKHMR